MGRIPVLMAYNGKRFDFEVINRSLLRHQMKVIFLYSSIKNGTLLTLSSISITWSSRTFWKRICWSLTPWWKRCQPFRFPKFTRRKVIAKNWAFYALIWANAEIFSALTITIIKLHSPFRFLITEKSSWKCKKYAIPENRKNTSFWMTFNLVHKSSLF